MSRATEFINYINSSSEPNPLEKITLYSNITFTDRLNKAKKLYKKRIKEDNGKRNT